MKHGIHLEPCYKKFTVILSQKNPCSQSLSPLKRTRLSGENGAKNVMSEEYSFCKMYRMNRQQKSTCQSITVCIEQAVNTIKQAAEANEDQSLYKIRNLDLIAKEFKYHERCHKDYTWKGKLSTPCLYEKKGNFEKVKEKEEKVLTESQAVSMCILHDLYGLSTDDIRYRSKLKARIQSESTDKLHFVFILKETTPEVVISTESIKFHVLLNDKGHLLNQAAEYLRADTEESAKN